MTRIHTHTRNMSDYGYSRPPAAQTRNEQITESIFFLNSFFYEYYLWFFVLDKWSFSQLNEYQVVQLCTLSKCAQNETTPIQRTNPPVNYLRPKLFDLYVFFYLKKKFFQSKKKKNNKYRLVRKREIHSIIHCILYSVQTLFDSSRKQEVVVYKL